MDGELHRRWIQLIDANHCSVRIAIIDAKAQHCIGIVIYFVNEAVQQIVSLPCWAFIIEKIPEKPS